MSRIDKKTYMILMSLGLILVLGGMTLIHSKNGGNHAPANQARLPIVIAHVGTSPGLERPPVAFDHDRHAAALKQARAEDCSACHQLKETDPHVGNGVVQVFKFPKCPVDMTDKSSLMYAYHRECVGCHKSMTTEGKATGPLMGLCGKCHVKRAELPKVAWAWSPVFDYARHARHVQAAERFDPADNLNIAAKIEIVGAITKAEEKCLLCHHTYDKKQKKLIYNKNTENSCRACHKATDEENARSMKRVAHAACIGCHMKLAEKARKELVQQGRTEFTEEDKKKFGPFDCKGCHEEHKELTPEERIKIPRLVRGQKDMIDLSLQAPGEPPAGRVQQVSLQDSPPIRMKAVPYNHRAHEPRGQFCNSCHHYSLEKCSNCHTPEGDAKKGGGINYERAFHKAEAGRSCVGCHATAKADMKCAGCHQWMTTGMPRSSCPVCHRGPSQGEAIEVPPTPLVVDKEKVPEKQQIKTIEKEFKPAEFPHLKIVNKLITISNESSLARWFHAAKEQALCSGCHHRSELQQAAVKVPKCVTCHTHPFQTASLGKPGILGAYHRQCIGCHDAMKQKPAALECVKCHPAKEEAQTAGVTSPKDVTQ